MSAELLDTLRAAIHTTTAATPPAHAREAAVLLLVESHDPRLPLLFIQRPDHMREHVGQIAFPGGGRDPEDASIEATALREAYEEVGLVPRDTTILGSLSAHMTAISARWLTPIVALSSTPWQPTPNPAEVAETFWVSLHALLAAPHVVRSMSRDGQTRPVHFYTADERVIWGVTGTIVHELLERLGRSD